MFWWNADLDNSSMCFTPLAHTVPSPELWVWQGFNKYLLNAEMNHYEVTAFQINLFWELHVINPPTSPPGISASLPSPALGDSVSPISAMLTFWISCYKLNFHISNSMVATILECGLSFRISFLTCPLAVGRLGCNPHSHTESHGQGNSVTSTHHSGSAYFTGGQSLHMKVHRANYKPQ